MRRLAATVLTALLTGAVLLTAAPAQSSQSVWQVFTVPADGTFTVMGHGYGHGHGMSQYGAEGAARRGLTHEQILRFYYPGTNTTKVRGNIRVLITADTTADVVVRTVPGMRVRDLANGRAYDLPANGASAWRLHVSDTGKSIVQYRVGDAWRWFRPDGASSLVGDGELSAAGRVLTLVTPYGDKRYRGSLRGIRPSAGSYDRDTVNVLPVHNYVKGVVASEMPASWQPEAVQAQSVAARTYAMWSRRDRLDRAWQICDTTSCQVYKGVDGEHAAASEAVDATWGQILRYDGDPAFTQFSASSGGWTSAGSVPYLVSKEDPYDGWSGNAVHDWSTTVDEAVVERTYPAIGELTKIRITQREGGGDWAGRAESVTFLGTKGSRTVSGTDVRSLFGLRSSWFWFKA